VTLPGFVLLVALAVVLYFLLFWRSP